MSLAGESPIDDFVQLTIVVLWGLSDGKIHRRMPAAWDAIDAESKADAFRKVRKKNDEHFDDVDTVDFEISWEGCPSQAWEDKRQES